MSEAKQQRVNLRPLRFVAALRVMIAAVLVAFGIVLFLSFGRREEEPVRIHLSSPAASPGETVVDLSDNFVITGTKGGADSFRMVAEQVTGFAGDKKLLKGVHLEVFGQDGQRITLTGPTGQFDLGDKRAQLAGDVVVEGKNGFKLRSASLYYDGERDMIFTPDEIRFETDSLAGRGRGLNFLPRTETLKIPADVRVTARTPDGSAVEVTSGDLTMALRENEVVFNDSVLLTRGPERFSGNYLKVLLDESRKHVVSVKAYGQVSALLVPGRGAAPATLKADSLEASLAGEDATVETVKALGNCRLESRGMTATSASLQAETATDRIALRGDPVVSDSRTRIAAQEIDLHVAERGLEARGDVKTSLRPDGPETAGKGPSYFSGKDPIYFQSANLIVEDGGSVARYSGSARGWQGDDSIQAEEIVLDFPDHRMNAYRNVLCRFLETGASGSAGSASSPAGPTVIVSSGMDYSDAEGTIHFRDGVKLTRQETTVLADRMHVTLTDPALGRRQIGEALAEGTVRFTHLSNSGSADRLLYLPSKNLAEMQQAAGLAEVVDHTNGRTLRGKTLTFDLAGNRVLTETSGGGRTWITLSPKDRDGRGIESKIGH